MAEQFIETEEGFLNTRFIERIWWDKHTDGWALKLAGDESTYFPRSEDAINQMLVRDPFE